MSPNLLDKIKVYGSPFMKSLVSAGAPSVLRGLIIEYLGDIDIQLLQGYVESDTSLWSLIDIDNQAKLKNLCSNIKDKTWLTAEWLMDSGQQRISRLQGSDNPQKMREKLKLCALMSYFIGSRKAIAWLEKQTVIIKSELSQ